MHVYPVGHDIYRYVGEKRRTIVWSEIVSGTESEEVLVPARAVKITVYFNDLQSVSFSITTVQVMFCLFY